MNSRRSWRSIGRTIGFLSVLLGWCDPALAVRFLVVVVPGMEQEQALATAAAELLIARIAQEGIESLGPEGIERDFSEASGLRRCALDVECISRAALALGIQRVFLGILARSGEQRSGTLEVIDTTDRRTIARGETGLVAEADLAPRITEVAGRLLAELQRPSATRSTLELRINGPPANQILLNGRAVGSGDRWRGSELDPGDHELVLELANGARIRRHLVLEPGSQDLTVHSGDDAPAWEKHLRLGEEQLFHGEASKALLSAQKAITGEGALLAETHLLLARSCLQVLEGPEGRPALVELAFAAVRWALEHRGGATALRLQAELVRRFTRVRLEPGVNWTDPGPIQVSVMSAPTSGKETLASYMKGLTEDLGQQPWTLPKELYLPRPGRYLINDRELLVSPLAESRTLVLAITPISPHDLAADHPTIDLTAFLAFGGETMPDLFAGAGVMVFPACRGSWCFMSRLMVNSHLTAGEVREEQQIWLKAGPGIAWLGMGRRLRLDATVEWLYSPASGEGGLAFGGALGWLLFHHLRVALSPSWNLFRYQVADSALGVQLETGLEW